MDRDLAARYGVPYVHLAAFTIDVDRVREADPAEQTLPMGWEVALTERYLARFIQGEPSDARLEVLEECCMGILGLTRGDDPLGSQLPFAVFCGISHGVLPAQLHGCLERWKSPPVDLAAELASWRSEPATQARIIQHCMGSQLQPPLSPPTLACLSGWSTVPKS